MKLIDSESSLWKALNSKSPFYKIVGWTIFSVLQARIASEGNPLSALRLRPALQQWNQMGVLELWVKWVTASAYCLVGAVGATMVISFTLYQIIRLAKHLQAKKEVVTNQ